jgi:putative endopeptidase
MLSIDPNEFEKSIRPADDFFGYVNAQWIKKNPIPPEELSWGSFDVLWVNVERQLKEILDEISGREQFSDKPEDVDAKKVRDFYHAAMDMAQRDNLGVTPLAELFLEVDTVPDIKTLARVVGVLHRIGAGGLWSPFVEQDEKQSEVMTLHLWQGGLGLPDRDYYLNDDEKSKKIRADYILYIKDLWAMAQLPDAEATSASVMEIETRLAKASLTRVELRDVERMYNKITIAEFTKLAPAVAIADYFAGIQITAPQYAIVGQPKFFEEIGKILADTSLDTLKIYLKWHVLNSFAPYLSGAIERRRFDFYAPAFSGAKEMKPLWRRALQATDQALEELLGKLYVAKYFSEDAKKKINDLVERLVIAYRARIEKLDWMSPETKKKALEKLGTVNRKLGYPDAWKDYSALVVKEDSFAENVMKAHALEFDRKMRQVGGPVDRGEWLMSPQTVNAYYMPPMNDIVFPAAILQPPFFDPLADDAINFGGIGSVIGHELTHGFDDQGSRFDASGNLNEWWTADDKKQFDAKGSQLAEQFDKYEPVPGVHVNGKLTLGENIADLGGLLIAYDGLKLKGKNDASNLIDGLTPEQRFFINYAVTERGHAREELLRLRLQVDPHSPSEFRVNGPVSNIGEFYEAFDTKEGDKLWRKPEDRARIW